MTRTVLIDADILAYQIAVGQEEVYEFNGMYTISADLNKAVKEVENAIGYIIETVDADGAELFITPNRGPNFRKGVLPTYKENRKSRKPLLVEPIKDWMMVNTACFKEAKLEADDLIGMKATMPSRYVGDERVIFSADKDLRTVPGLHWDAEDGEIVDICDVEATAFFYEQVLTGDPVDNYKGCPGVGPVGAAKLLGTKLGQPGNYWSAYTHKIKSGPNSGSEVMKWRLLPDSPSPWTSIVSAYYKEGLTAEDALVQARCARILRHGEYNFKTQEVKLWTP